MTVTVNIITSSPKKHDQFRAAQVAELVEKLAISNDDDEEEFETDREKNQFCNLKRAGDTRWGSISSLMNLYSATCTVLKDIINDPESIRKQR